MSEFDEARLAAAAWVRAQMDRYGLSLDDLVAAGCFSGTNRAKRSRAAAADPANAANAADAADAPASSPASADPPIPAIPPATPPTPSTASSTAAAASAANESAPPQPAGVLYRNALGQCWDGTGEMPDWLQRAVNAGQTPEFYRVG